MTNEYSEDALVEQPAIVLLKEMRWDYANCYNEVVGDENSTLGRRTTQEVILVSKLRPALERLNPTLPDDAIEQAIEEVVKDRSALSLVEANREVYRLIKNGAQVSVEDADGSRRTELVRVIEWDQPENNDFFLASQFRISGEMYKRRADLVGFVNGIPLAFMNSRRPTSGWKMLTGTTCETIKKPSLSFSSTTVSSSFQMAARASSAA